MWENGLTVKVMEKGVGIILTGKKNMLELIPMGSMRDSEFYTLRMGLSSMRESGLEVVLILKSCFNKL